MCFLFIVMGWIIVKMLNKEQQEALEFINSGENIFLTGDAGTGKSFLLDHYIDNTKKKVTAKYPSENNLL